VFFNFISSSQALLNILLKTLPAFIGKLRQNNILDVQQRLMVQHTFQGPKSPSQGKSSGDVMNSYDCDCDGDRYEVEDDIELGS
jgi:hypothetical protein